MHSLDLVKPDGRALTLYARRPIAPVTSVPSPFAEPLASKAHLRWHPLRGEWVTYAAHRQDRTFQPPPEYDPLAATVDPQRPTELPGGAWDIAVFDNRFPALGGQGHSEVPQLHVPTAPAGGHCEVVVYTPDRDSSLGALSLDHLELLLSVWADRTRRLGSRDDVRQVFPFENRGVEVGVTLQHPHGQIYAYPFVPPIPARELANQQAYFDAHGSGLVEALVAAELAAARRLLYEGAEVAAFVPICARYPYEVWIAPRRPVESIAALNPEMRADFARALKTVLLKYDALWDRPFPYIMAMHQAPTDGRPHPEAHLHVEFYPAYRMRDRLKYLAGSEIGAGVFTADTDPDAKAAELRAIPVTLE
jgi:UDPglucose--hexose-1-phosphate uridylyltransferase